MKKTANVTKIMVKMTDIMRMIVRGAVVVAALFMSVQISLADITYTRKDGTEKTLVGDGTQTNPYKLTEPEDFLTINKTHFYDDEIFGMIFGSMFHAGYTESTLYMTLENDISFDGIEINGLDGDIYMPLGFRIFDFTKNGSFVFDGQGHTLSDINIDGSNTTTPQDFSNPLTLYNLYCSALNLGIFDALGPGSEIKNLTVKNVHIKSRFSSDPLVAYFSTENFEERCVGILAGRVAGDATISNCKVLESSISGVLPPAGTGGLVGRISIPLKDIKCVIEDVETDIEISSGEPTTFVGGLIGSVNIFTLESKTDEKLPYFQNITVNNAKVTGEINVPNADYVGGGIGFLSSTTCNDVNAINEISNYAAVTGNTFVGGIVGYVNSTGIPNSKFAYEKNPQSISKIAGDLTVSLVSEFKPKTTFDDDKTQCITYDNGKIRMSNLMNAGDIKSSGTSDGSFTGGCVGFASCASFKSLVNIGTVESYNKYLGGCVGYYESNLQKDNDFTISDYVDDCLNRGFVKVTEGIQNVPDFMGGVIGRFTFINKGTTQAYDDNGGGIHSYPKNLISPVFQSQGSQILGGTGDDIWNNSNPYKCRQLYGAGYSCSNVPSRDTIYDWRRTDLDLTSPDLPLVYYYAMENEASWDTLRGTWDESGIATLKHSETAFVKKDKHFPKIQSDGDIASVASSTVVFDNITTTVTIDTVPMEMILDLRKKAAVTESEVVGNIDTLYVGNSVYITEIMSQLGANEYEITYTKIERDSLGYVSKPFYCGVGYGCTWESKQNFVTIDQATGKATPAVIGRDTLVCRKGTAYMEYIIDVVSAKKGFSGGTGKEFDPYIISNVDDLVELNDSLAQKGSDWSSDKYFRIENDIKSDTTVIAPDENNPFKGYLDGNDRTIVLDIDKNGNAGFIANAEDAEVHNVHTAGVVKGTENVGGLIGSGKICTVYKCYNTAKIFGKNVGGICGYVNQEDKYGTAQGRLFSLSNAGTISSMYDGSYAGGIIGCLEKCATDEPVYDFINAGHINTTDGSTYAGGIFGRLDVYGTKTLKIKNTFSYGTVTVINNNKKNIKPYYSFSSGAIEMSNSAYDVQCLKNLTSFYDGTDMMFSEMTVPSEDFERLEYSAGKKGNIIPVWVKKMTDYQLLGITHGFRNFEVATNVQTEPDITLSSEDIESFGQVVVIPHESVTDTFYKVTDLISNENVNAFISLISKTGDQKDIEITIPKKQLEEGKGTKDDPYIIHNTEELRKVSDLMINNPDYNGYSKWSSESWSPNWSKDKYFLLVEDLIDRPQTEKVTFSVGQALTYKKIVPFAGFFDGGGHLIDLAINTEDKDSVGLFAAMSDDAIVHDLDITGSVRGKSYVGGLVGSSIRANGGLIYNVTVNAEIFGVEDYVGTIVGASGCEIRKSASAGKVNCNGMFAGGIAGKANRSVVGCTNIANVAGRAYVGGIAGQAEATTRDTIGNCVNAGMIYFSKTNVPGAKDTLAATGGIVGSTKGMTVLDNFNYNRVSGTNIQNGRAVVGLMEPKAGTEYSIMNNMYDSQLSTTGDPRCNKFITTELLNKNNPIFSIMSHFSGYGWNANTENDTLEYSYVNVETTGNVNAIAKVSAATLILHITDNEKYESIDAVENYAYCYADFDVSISSKHGLLAIDKTSEKGTFTEYKVSPIFVGVDTIVAEYKGFKKEIHIQTLCAPVRDTIKINSCGPVFIRGGKLQKDSIYSESTIFDNVYVNLGTACDSTMHFEIIVRNPEDRDTIICGDVFGQAKFQDKWYNADTVVLDTNVCVRTRLHINKPIENSKFVKGCDVVEYSDKVFKESTVVIDTIKSLTCGCDSIYTTLEVQVNNSYNGTEKICGIDSVVAKDGNIYYSDTEFTTTYSTVYGCDSIVGTVIEIVSRTKSVRDTFVCEKYIDPITNIKYTEDTVLIDTFDYKCIGDSTSELIVHIYKSTEADTTILEEEVHCGMYQLMENGFIVETIRQDSLLNLYTHIPREHKCDSILVQPIRVSAPAMRPDDIVYRANDSYYDEERGQSFDKSTIVIDTFRNIYGCDSVIQRVRYEILNAVHDSLPISGCSSAIYTTFDGVKLEFDSDTIISDTLFTEFGLDSIIRKVNVHVANPIYDTLNIVSCGEAEYEGVIYYEDKTFDQTFQSNIGGEICDSLLRHVEIKIVTSIVNKKPTIYGCDSLVYGDYNTVVKSTFTDTINRGLAANGVCDSIDVQRVVIFNSKRIYHDYVDACGMVEYDGVTYYSSTVFQKSVPRDYCGCDCDSIVEVSINIRQADTTWIDTAMCDAVILNGVEYTTDGEIVEYRYTNSYDCESIIYYKVKILEPTYSNDSIFGESSVVYKGETYRRSTTIIDTTVNSVGCDSIMTLNIVIEKDLGYPVIVDKFGYMLLCNNKIGDQDFKSYQWYRNGEVIEGATKTYYEGDYGTKLSGCYQVVVETKEGREFQSEIYCIDEERTLKIYPNPAKVGDIINIDYNFTAEEKEKLRVEVFDAMGTFIGSFEPKSYPINIDFINTSGLHFIMIIMTDGTVLDARVIVK